METKDRINVIKRNGSEVDFHQDKIIHAIEKANNEVSGIHRLNEYQIQAIADKITAQIARNTASKSPKLMINSLPRMLLSKASTAE